MADIAMCANKTCPERENCYRQQAKPNDHWQTMQAFQYTVATDGVFWCNGFWPIEKTQQSDSFTS